MVGLRRGRVQPWLLTAGGLFPPSFLRLCGCRSRAKWGWPPRLLDAFDHPRTHPILLYGRQQTLSLQPSKRRRWAALLQFSRSSSSSRVASPAVPRPPSSRCCPGSGTQSLSRRYRRQWRPWISLSVPHRRLPSVRSPVSVATALKRHFAAGIGASHSLLLVILIRAALDQWSRRTKAHTALCALARTANTASSQAPGCQCFCSPTPAIHAIPRRPAPRKELTWGPCCALQPACSACAVLLRQVDTIVAWRGLDASATEACASLTDSLGEPEPASPRLLTHAML